MIMEGPIGLSWLYCSLVQYREIKYQNIWYL